MAPMDRPDQMCVALQVWRDLLFLHWAVPVREVRRLLPEGLTPDLYRGVAYVGVAVIDASEARPAFIPLHVGLKFMQVSVRTYVLSAGENPGVYLLSHDSTSRVVARFMRTFLNVPSFRSALGHDTHGRDIHVRLERGGLKPAELEVNYGAARELGELNPGSLPFFLLERYMLYFESAGLLFRTRFHHAPYRARNARVRSISGDLVEAAGVETLAHVSRHAYHVDRIELEIFPPELVERPVEVYEPEWAPVLPATS